MASLIQHEQNGNGNNVLKLHFMEVTADSCFNVPALFRLVNVYSQGSLANSLGEMKLGFTCGST
jgi:hypothetical protein